MTFPPQTPADIDSYDHAEVVAGYTSYERGDPTPGPNHSDGFRWGWQNGFNDSNKGDDGFQALRFAYIRDRRARGLSLTGID